MVENILKLISILWLLNLSGDLGLPAKTLNSYTFCFIWGGEGGEGG